jgi:hypothetical protein
LKFPLEREREGDIMNSKAKRTIAVDVSMVTTWLPVMAAIMILICCLILYSLRSSAFFWAFVSIFFASISIILASFLPSKVASFNVNTMMCIWLSWISYGTLIKDSEFILSEQKGFIPSFVIVAVVAATYIQGIAGEKKFILFGAIICLATLLFPHKGNNSFFLDDSIIILHTLIYVVIYLFQEYVLIKKHKGIQVLEDEEEIVYHTAVKIIQSGWVLFVYRYILLFLFVQLLVIGWDFSKLYNKSHNQTTGQRTSHPAPDRSPADMENGTADEVSVDVDLPQRVRELSSNSESQPPLHQQFLPLPPPSPSPENNSLTLYQKQPLSPAPRYHNQGSYSPTTRPYMLNSQYQSPVRGGPVHRTFSPQNTSRTGVIGNENHGKQSVSNPSFRPALPSDNGHSLGYQQSPPIKSSVPPSRMPGYPPLPQRLVLNSDHIIGSTKKKQR